MPSAGDQLHHPQEPERRPLRQRLRLPPTTAAATSATSALAGASARWRRIASMSSRWPTTTSRSASAPSDRGYTYNYQPGRGLDYSSGTASPGNWSQGANASNPPAAGGCKGADLIPRNGICRQSLWRYLDLVPETEKTSVFSRATGKLADEHNVSLSISGRATTTLPRSAQGPHRPADRSRHRLLSRQRHHSRTRRLRPRPEPAGGGQLATECARAAPAILAEHRPAPAARLRRPGSPTGTTISAPRTTRTRWSTISTAATSMIAPPPSASPTGR